MTIAGLILAGGESRRMGREKAFVTIAGLTLLDRVIAQFSDQVGALAINANGDPGRFARHGFPVVPNDRPSSGPLAGVLAGMRWAEKLPTRPRYLATVPIDAPFMPGDLVARLDAARGASALVAIAASGDRDHPVFGLWPIAFADRLDAWRQSARSQGVRGFLAATGFAVVQYPLPERGPDPFFNVNTPENAAEAEGWLAATAQL